MNMNLGLDLGQHPDYSALVVTERVHRFTNPDRPSRDHVEDAYQVRHVQRWRLGTPYTAVIDDVAELMRRPDLDDSLLVFDRSGVGGAVADLVHKVWREGGMWRGGECPFGSHGRMPQGITFTAGFAAYGAAQGYLGATTAHKGDVIRRMVMLLNTGRLVLPPGLPGGEQLEKELRAYTIKQHQRTGYEYTEAKRESDHDDLVIALALSVWCKNFYGPEPRYIDAQSGELREKPEGTRTVYTEAT
ncbi:MAG TPA: hypothetical protein VJ787_05045 [Thermoleophilia bacterium]|nr:hypothetical protein [Thermoleophilia bacterium]